MTAAERRTMREEPLRLDGIELRIPAIEVRDDQPVRRPRHLGGPRPSADPPTGASVWLFELPREPWVALEFETSAENFSHIFEIEGWNVGPPSGWRPLASRTLHRIRVDGARSEDLTVRLVQAERRSKYRLTVRNLDSPPIELTGVVATAEVWEEVFFSQPCRVYTLLYGGSGHRAPRYDIASVLGSIQRCTTVPARLGPASPNPGYSAGVPAAAGQTLLFVAIGCAALVLAWAVARSARWIGRPEVEDSPPPNAGE